MVLVIVMGIFFTLSLLEWLVIGLIITVVLVAEVLNSAIERTVDYISTDIHPDAKVIKDMAAGAVQIGKHTSELQSRGHLVCRLLLEKKNSVSSNTPTT